MENPEKVKKAVLVIDAPDNCWQCPLTYFCSHTRAPYCTVLRVNVQEHLDGRHELCRLAVEAAQ